MGAVYEALTKSERERKERERERNDAEIPAWSDVSSDGNGKARPEEFDFVRYSLSSPAADELQRVRREKDLTARERALLARPAREATVNIGQIDPHLVAFYESDPAAASEYGKLAGSLIAAGLERNLKRLLIASAQHGDGRTSVALNLACALAQAKKRILLVDTDLQRPSVLRLLGIESQLDIAECVARGLPAGASAVQVLPYGFVVLPTRERRENSAELLASADFNEMLNTLEPEYDFMLFDSPPLRNGNGQGLLASLTNAVVLVVRAERTTARSLERAIAPFNEDEVVAVVLNRAAPQAAARM